MGKDDDTDDGVVIAARVSGPASAVAARLNPDHDVSESSDDAQPHGFEGFWVHLRENDPDARVYVYRHYPDEWDGVRVKKGKLFEGPIAGEPGDFMNLIEERYGGGDYSIQLRDFSKNGTKGQITHRVEGSPTDECFVGTPPNAQPEYVHEPGEDATVVALREQNAMLLKMALDKNNDDGTTTVLTQFMERQSEQSRRDEQERQRRHDLEVEERKAERAERDRRFQAERDDRERKEKVEKEEREHRWTMEKEDATRRAKADRDDADRREAFNTKIFDAMSKNNSRGTSAAEEIMPIIELYDRIKGGAGGDEDKSMVAHAMDFVKMLPQFQAGGAAGNPAAMDFGAILDALTPEQALALKQVLETKLSQAPAPLPAPAPATAAPAPQPTPVAPAQPVQDPTVEATAKAQSAAVLNQLLDALRGQAMNRPQDITVIDHILGSAPEAFLDDVLALESFDNIGDLREKWGLHAGLLGSIQDMSSASAQDGPKVKAWLARFWAELKDEILNMRSAIASDLPHEADPNMTDEDIPSDIDGDPSLDLVEGDNEQGHGGSGLPANPGGG